jgi:hypothetical protein
MNSGIKIIKRSQTKISTGTAASRDEQTDAQGTREMVRTVKGWVSELQQRRRDQSLVISAFRQGQIVKLPVPTTQ